MFLVGEIVGLMGLGAFTSLGFTVEEKVKSCDRAAVVCWGGGDRWTVWIVFEGWLLIGLGGGGLVLGVEVLMLAVWVF